MDRNIRSIGVWLVEAEIQYVMNAPLMSGGAFLRRERACMIDFDRWYRADPATPEYEWYLACLASTIVHETMQGRLYSLGIPYNKRTRLRSERICVRRQRRFAARLRSARYNLLDVAPAFDAARWAPFWDQWKRRKLRWEYAQRFWCDFRTHVLKR